MFTLSTFYKSKEWERLRNCLLLERQDASGYLVCEICGKPIVKKYDAILHHKTPLNEMNVNNAEIALNPDNLAFVHFGCHNGLHNRAGNHRRAVYLVYGSPCAGKNTFVARNANEDDLVVDLDAIWQCISQCNPKEHPQRVKANAFAVRDCLIEQIKIRVGMWRNAFVIGGYPLRNERDRLCDLLGAEPVFIEATQEECLARAEQARPAEFRAYIEDWFRNYTA